MFLFLIYPDVQPQEPQVLTIRICEYVNMFTSRNEWNIRICIEINSRTLNFKKFWTILEYGQKIF